MNEISVSVTYKIQGQNIFDDLKDELQKECIVNIKSRPGTAAMGIWDAIVDIVLNLELKDYVMFVLGGASWDLVKQGTRTFFLRPIIELFKKFELEHKGFDYIGGLRLNFQDTAVTIYGLEDLFTTRVGTVMPALVKHYHNLLNEKAVPHTIFIPITYDEDQQKFVDYGDGESFTVDQYLTYWGIAYDAFGYDTRIYDVKKSTLLAESFSR